MLPIPLNLFRAVVRLHLQGHTVATIAEHLQLPELLVLSLGRDYPREWDEALTWLVPGLTRELIFAEIARLRERTCQTTDPHELVTLAETIMQLLRLLDGTPQMVARVSPTLEDFTPTEVAHLEQLRRTWATNHEIMAALVTQPDLLLKCLRLGTFPRRSQSRNTTGTQPLGDV